jgi:ferrous iron transport protein B
MEKVVVALIGNPNVGKSQIFNNLTGGRAHVGNWPGKTVEKKEGKCVHKGVELHIIDLPGTYSLTAHSIDELIARNFIVEEKPDVVVDIVDASNLERNLYLLLQLLELEANVVVALNKWDVAESLGYEINVDELSRLLGVPVIPTVATEKIGMEELKDAILEAAKRKERRKDVVKYGEPFDGIISEIASILQKDSELSSKYPVRWLAIKVLEADEEVMKTVSKSPVYNELKLKLEEAKKVLGEDMEIALAERRYSIIAETIIPRVLIKGARPLTLTDLLDKAFLSKHLGIPIFLALWWALFRFAFDVSAPFSNMLSMLFTELGKFVSSGISDPQLAGLVADGIFGGLGTVLSFFPPIFFLFLGLAVLEDSGYLPRAAFVMDRLMVKLGLHGRSFIPMLLGFGCNVPAVMATRTIEREEDRILTILVNPLMSCSARLPVYLLIASAVLGPWAAAATYSMYILGIALAILMAKLFRTVIPYFKGKPSPLIMELPLYAVPTVRTTLIHAWERGRLFLRKAGTIILLVVILSWFLSNYPWEAVHQNGEFAIENSYIAQLGRLLEPYFRPLGFNWMAVVALFFGFLAKEAVVGTFATMLGVSEEEASSALASAGVFTPLTGFAFMAFTLTYTPCMATLGAIYRETNSWKWTIFAVVYELALAYLVALGIVTFGRLLGFT